MALADGGVRAIASGVNQPRNALCRICIVLDKASGPAGQSDRGASILVWVRRRSRLDNLPAQDWLPSSGFRLQLVMTSGSRSDHEGPCHLLTRGPLI